jgi:hypothetical protein
MSRIHLGLPNASKLLCLDRNVNRNRDVKFLECDYLLVQRCVKLTLVHTTIILGPTSLLSSLVFVTKASPLYNE